MRYIILSAGIFTCLGSIANAQAFTGGELNIDIYSFSEGESLGAINYAGALEYAVNRNISIAGEFAAYDFDVFDATASSYALHAIYHVNATTSLGVFSGREELENRSIGFTGLEARYEAIDFAVEGYLAEYDGENETSVFSLSGSYFVDDQIAVIGDLGRASQSTDDISRLSVGAEYSFFNGVTLYGEVGTLDVGSVDSSFIGLGAEIEFGRDGGTTFDRRGFFASVVPGI